MLAQVEYRSGKQGLLLLHAQSSSFSGETTGQPRTGEAKCFNIVIPFRQVLATFSSKRQKGSANQPTRNEKWSAYLQNNYTFHCSIPTPGLDD